MENEISQGVSIRNITILSWTETTNKSKSHVTKTTLNLEMVYVEVMHYPLESFHPISIQHPQ